MKGIFCHFLSGLFLLIIVPILNSCTDPNSPQGTDPNGNLFEGTVILEQNANAPARKIISSTTDWIINNSFTWFVVSPFKGSAGDTEIGIKSSSANEDIMERVGYFTVNDVKHYVVQKGILSIMIERNEFLVAAKQTELFIPIVGTYPLDQIKVASDAAWAEFSSIDITKDPILLEDGVTYSAYNEAAIRIAITEQNTSSDSRRANISIIAGDQEFDVALVQVNAEGGEVDLFKEFYRASVIHKGTGTWCQNCPLMSVQLEEVEEKEPDALFVINCHQGSSGTLDWGGTNDIFAHFGITGLPQGFFNGIADIGRSANALASQVSALMNEARTYYPAGVAIAAESKVSEGKIKIDVKLASKVSDDYMITVFFLENGIEAPQADSYNVIEDPEHYIHNNVLRGTATEGYKDGGDKIELPFGVVVKESFEVEVPKNVLDVNNLDVLIYITYPGAPVSKIVAGALYKDYGYVVDNAVKIPAVDGKTGFRYLE